MSNPNLDPTPNLDPKPNLDANQTFSYICPKMTNPNPNLEPPTLTLTLQP